MSSSVARRRKGTRGPSLISSTGTRTNGDISSWALSLGSYHVTMPKARKRMFTPCSWMDPRARSLILFRVVSVPLGS